MTTSHPRFATLALTLLSLATACPDGAPGATTEGIASTTGSSTGEPTPVTPTSGGVPTEGTPEGTTEGTTDGTTEGTTEGTGTASSGDDGTQTGDLDTTSSGSTGAPVGCGELGVLQGSYAIESELDIAGLLPFREVTGDLTIVAPGLLSLDGLQCLRRVGRDLEIEDTALTSLTGLDGLEEVGGQLVIARNAQLADLHALASLTTIGAEVMLGYLTIEVNPALTDLTGLGALSFVGWSVELTANGIESVAGLGAAQVVAEVRIEHNEALVDTLGLAAFIPNSLAIGHNPKLACSNAEQALALMQANGFDGGSVFYDNLGGCGI